MEEDYGSYKEYIIPKFGIKFRYPAWWQQSMEMGNTHFFRDEHAGIFRITPFSGTYKEEGFLQKRFDEYKENAVDPSWKTFNGRVYLYHEEDLHPENLKIHNYMATAKNLIVICSFEYAKKLLDNEYSKNKVEGAIKEVEKVLSGLTING